MRLRLTTEVDGDYQEVMARFDKRLFEALMPKLGKMEVREFTGSKKGDVVRLQFIRPIKAEWVSDITEHGSDDHEAYFIDVGKTLPFPLAIWRHKHIVRKVSEYRSLIIDDITYQGKNFVWTLFLYPALFIGFYPRKQIYKKYFRRVD